MRWHASMYSSVLAIVFAILSASARHAAYEESVALTHLFAEIDANHDGQVDETEAKKYIGERIGGREYDSPVELNEAFNHMVSNIDQDRTHTTHTISEAEVKRHLQNMQHAVSVKEWVQHGLGLPQYAEVFRRNVITVADFPLMIEDAGSILEEELQIKSRLHRNQIVRGMKRLILGLGELPSAPQVMGCERETETESTLHWLAPVYSGDPPVHKYVIESLEHEESAAVWTPAVEVDAWLNQRQYKVTLNHSPKKQTFRILAWTAYGHSPYATFEWTDTSTRTNSFPSASRSSKTSVEMSQRSRQNQIQNAGTSKAGYWSLFVIGVTIALRVLTSRNVAILKCCLLSKLEKLVKLLGMHTLAKQIHAIERQECACCRAARLRGLKPVHEEPTHPALIKEKAKSHKIEPTQHFGMEPSHMVFSKSSPALGDFKTEYKVSEWDAKEAVEAVEALPVPQYSVQEWEENSDSFPSSASLSQISSSSDVPVGLIEGQCAFEGCLREWKGMLQFRNRWSRHFCSVCLRTYCYEHTHISPHGSFGSCGQQSGCVCETCFYTLPPATQAQLEATNRLDKSPSRKAALERGCCRRDSHSSVRSFLGLKKLSTRKTQCENMD